MKFHSPTIAHRVARSAAATFAALLLLGSCGSEQKEQQTEEQPEQRAEPPRVKGPDYRMPVRMDSLRPNLAGEMIRIFNDSNYLQLAHAAYMGIEPIATADQVNNTTRPLQKIYDTETYRLDNLTHSVPYLVPEAATLLKDIAQAFQDTIKRRGLSPLKLKVTSLLRPTGDVQKLVRVNGNAVQNSAHQYATTFDITYASFFDKNGNQVFDTRYKLALAEALYDLRAANRCMVKYEIKSPCFHITVIR